MRESLFASPLRRRDAETQRKSCFFSKRPLRLWASASTLTVMFALAPLPAFAQQPPAPILAQLPPQMIQPVERVTLEEAVARALKNNPTIAAASQAVLRAEGLLQQARAATRPNASAVFLNSVV